MASSRAKTVLLFVMVIRNHHNKICSGDIDWLEEFNAAHPDLISKGGFQEFDGGKGAPLGGRSCFERFIGLKA